MSRKNSYIFTNKNHSQKGIMATILGVISLVSLIYAIAMSYKKDGVIPSQYGAATLLVTIFSLTGVVLGVISKTERDKYYIFSYLGIILNVLALAVVSAILYAGAYGIGSY
ncbi:MAG: hypothetical protein IJO97_01285 [Lachnospiraceae bacterium]|nr:hypothetical protein [Lachnospiraceae bacterium]